MYMLVRWRSGAPRPAELKTRDFERVAVGDGYVGSALGEILGHVTRLGNAVDGQSYISA